MNRPPIRPDRVRRIRRGFATVPNRFLHDGFLASLSHIERSLYLFLVLAADRNGISYYGYDRICSILEITPDQFVQARNGLINLDLIATDGTRYQVLSLPESPHSRRCTPLTSTEDFEDHDPATIRATIRASLNDA